MEKLSSILPNSPRVKSVDLSEAKPRRPGAPSFGVPVGTTSPKDRVTMSSSGSSGVDDASKDLLTYKNPKEARGAKIAEDISRKFFETRLLKEEASTPKTQVIAEEIVESAGGKASPEERPVARNYTPERIVAADIASVSDSNTTVE